MSEAKGEERLRRRSRAAAHFDEMTLAAFTVVVIVLVAAVIVLGAPAVGDRIGCGLNAYVNRLMAYPRPCYRPPGHVGSDAGAS